MAAATFAAETVISSYNATPYMAMLARVGLALSAIQRGDATDATQHHATLKPVLKGVRLFVGSGDRILGLLAQTMEKLDEAAAHFEDASAFCQQAGYRPEYAWSCNYEYSIGNVPDGTCGIRWENVVYWHWLEHYSEVDTLPNHTTHGLGDLEFMGPYPGCGTNVYEFPNPLTENGIVPFFYATSLLVQASDFDYLDQNGNIIDPPPPGSGYDWSGLPTDFYPEEFCNIPQGCNCAAAGTCDQLLPGGPSGFNYEIDCEAVGTCDRLILNDPDCSNCRLTNQAAEDCLAAGTCAALYPHKPTCPNCTLTSQAAEVAGALSPSRIGLDDEISIDLDQGNDDFKGPFTGSAAKLAGQGRGVN